MTKYTDRLMDDVEQWVAKHGLMERGGAELNTFLSVFHISDACHRKWLRLRPRYASAIDKGRKRFENDAAVIIVKSLFESARGGYHEETSETEDTKYIPDKKGNPTIREMTKRKTKTRKYTPPNTGAAIFLLTNLDPENWQNRQKQDVSIKPAEKEEEMSIEAIEAEIKRLEKLDRRTENKEDLQNE